ncbi:MAG: GNAT family N-acetyltransferase [Alphaproteobacteria bacterium]|nr:GNAT family N-acetyltransferase [Alphaproteobacteria bacterium]MBU0797985.1 GNAT family N-acetyltransferase [Alphaproteobacteria bacterium]MBU0887943.1 GNAT family N-acetyltransferase [Alphaproteobacteria bacterium]MBU1814834.1 GNAT family N-acetyltransferase [Alphaproteobacteria bacterium]
MLLIRPTNTKVKAFYERLGYREEERSLLTRWLRGGPDSDIDPAKHAEIETTVTYLEMTERPTRPSVPAPAMRLSLQRAEMPTVSFYRYLYNTIGAPWAWVSKRLESDADIKAVIQDDDVDIYVLSVAGVPAGMVQLDRREFQVVDIAYFGLMPDFIGHGLGKYLLNWGIDQAWESNPARVTVNTCDLDHPRALPLYQKCGFRPIRREVVSLAHPHLFGLEVPAHRR